MNPSERLIETLERYGEQAKDVQLTLTHNGPSVWNEMSRTKVGRYQACPPLRRKDTGTRLCRGSSFRSLHRQSLPPLSCLKQEDEQQKEVLKRPKRKSLTLMEEAWEWLESLGKGKVYSTASEKESSKKADKGNRTSLDVNFSVDKGNSGRSGKTKLRGKEKNLKLDLDDQISFCIGSQTKGKEKKQHSNSQEAKSDDQFSSKCAAADEEYNLRETIICQLSYLQDLQTQIASIEGQIFEIEGKQRVKRTEQETQQRLVEEEMEQIKFWENELKAEEGYEKDLQCQFLEMKATAVECKATLENYKRKMQGLDSFGQNLAQENSKMVLRVSANEATEISTVSSKDLSQQPSDSHGDVNINRKFLPKPGKPPHALVPPNQMKERRPTGPTELREWWTRWSEAQSFRSKTQKKEIHRSELTIYLSTTKV